MSETKSHELLTQYQAGHSEAAAAIFDRYVERLIALARARIGPKLKRKFDPDDIYNRHSEASLCMLRTKSIS